MYRYDRYQSMFHTGPAKLPYMVIHVVCNKLILMQKSKHNTVLITNVLLLM